MLTFLQGASAVCPCAHKQSLPGQPLLPQHALYLDCQAAAEHGENHGGGSEWRYFVEAPIGTVCGMCQGSLCQCTVICTLESFSNTQDVLIDVFFSKLVHAQYE